MLYAPGFCSVLIIIICFVNYCLTLTFSYDNICLPTCYEVWSLERYHHKHFSMLFGKQTGWLLWRRSSLIWWLLWCFDIMTLNFKPNLHHFFTMAYQTLPACQYHQQMLVSVQCYLLGSSTIIWLRIETFYIFNTRP